MYAGGGGRSYTVHKANCVRGRLGPSTQFKANCVCHRPAWSSRRPTGARPRRGWPPSDRGVGRALLHSFVRELCTPPCLPLPPPQEHTWRPAFGVVRQGSCGRALRWAAPAGGRAVAPWRVRRVPERRTRALVRTSCGRAREGAHRRTLVHPECGGPSKGHAGKPLSDAPWGLAKDKRKNTMENRRQGQQQQKTRRTHKLHCKTQNNSQIS